MRGRKAFCEGNDLEAVERAVRNAMPATGAYDLKLVFRGILNEGLLGETAAADRIAAMLVRPLRTFRDYARELVGATG